MDAKPFFDFSKVPPLLTATKGGNPLSASQSMNYIKRQSLLDDFSRTQTDSQESIPRPTRYRYSISGWFKTSSASEDADIISWFVADKGTKRNPLAYISRLPLASGSGSRSNPEPMKPRSHVAKIAIWSDLNSHTIERMTECRDADSVKQILADIFLLDNYKENLKEGIIMDLFYHALRFAWSENFSTEKISAVFSIIKNTFDVCIETPYGNLDHTYEYLKELLICHSVHHPPWSIELFSSTEVIKIMDYTISTLFRHFKLYKYVFTPTVRLDLTMSYVGMPEATSPVAEEEAAEDEEDSSDGDQAAQEEEDAEKLLAQEELKKIVTQFLTKEAKKIEGNVDQHLKNAINALNTKIDSLIEQPAKEKRKKSL